MSHIEQEYAARNTELLRLISFLQSFERSLEESSFVVFIDNQVLEYFFTVPELEREKITRLHTLGNFGIFLMTLGPEKFRYLKIKF